ncbi:MAG: CHAT domain-containing protein [Candidatus Hodarchaeota archaeon]
MSTPPKGDELFNSGLRYFKEKKPEKALQEWNLALNIYKEEGEKRKTGIVSTYIARALHELGRYKEALVSSTQAVRILREQTDPAALKQSLITMGRTMQSFGYLEEATQALEQAAEISSPSEDRRHRVILLTEISQALARAGRYRESATRLTEALGITKDLGDQQLHGDTLAEYARILQQLEEPDKAEKVFLQLIQLWKQIGNPELGAYAQLGLASTYLAKDLFDQAEACIQRAEAFFLKSADAMGTALTKYHKARILLQRGQPETALPLGEAALQYFQSQQNLLAYAETAIVVAQILEHLVQDIRSLRLFDKAIEMFSQVGEQARLLQTHVTKGIALLRLGNRRQAEQEFTQAIRYYQEHKRPVQEAQIYIQVANTFFQLAQFRDAIEQSKMAIQLLRSQQEESLEIKAYRLLLNALQQSQRLQEDLAFLRKAEREATTQGKNWLASSLGVSLALLDQKSQTPDQIRSTLENTIRSENLPEELRAEAAINLGLLFMKNEQYSEAAQYLSQAIKDFKDSSYFDKSATYHHLAEAYRHLKKPNLQKEALLGALQTIDPQKDEVLRGRICLELGPLIEMEDAKAALKYYNAATTIFKTKELTQELLVVLQHHANLLAQTEDYQQALELITEAVRVAEELDIPATGSIERPLEWKHTQQIVGEAINIAAHYYHKHADRAIINRVIDWSTPRKVIRLHPFLAETLGFERCPELSKLMNEDQSLLTKASELRQQLSQTTFEGVNQEETQTRRTALRSELDEVLENININRNVIAAACQDPGRGMVPNDYRMLEKLTALMPPDRRWILINYDVLDEKQRIIITTLDHVGRHTLHILPISADLESVVQRLQQVKTTQELPSIVDLRDMASFLYRSLIPSRLDRELQTHTYGFLQFITDGFLNNVPFDIMYDGKEYWGLKHPMAWVPDFQCLESSLKTKALAQSGPTTVLLGVNSNPDGRSARRQRAEEIARVFLAAVPNQQKVNEPIVLFGREFTRAQLARNVDQPRTLLYFSTPTTLHYRKGEIPLQHPDSLRVIEIGVSSIFRGAPILVLDESTRTEPRADGLSTVGFLRHLVAAGAPSILFTRWTPEPQLQPVFTQSLLKHLYEGDPIAVALFHTRRKLASKGPSPHSWLAYSLCGNPFPGIL